jgi:hypothetical protein
VSAVRSRIAFAAILAALGVAAGLALPGSAGAQPPPAASIGLAVSASSSSYPTGSAPLLRVRLTNLGAAACGLAATADLTLAVTSATVDGKALTPVYVKANPIDGAGSAVARRTSSVAPGGAVSFDVDTAGVQALPVSIGLDDGSELTALWPLSADGRYELSLSYAMPAVNTPTAACAGTSDAATVSFTIGGAARRSLPWLLFAIVAGGVLVMLVLAGLLLARSRRRQRSNTGAAAALVLLVAAGIVAVQGVTAARANAGVIYGPDPDRDKQIFNTYVGCITKITQFDPGLMKALEGPTVTVYPWRDSSSRPKTGGSGKDSIIAWDPFPGGGFTGETSGATYDPCAALYHELNHARDHASGTESNSICDDTGVLTDEVRATLAENRYRAAQTPPLPPRTTYDGKKIPSSMDGCTPPKKPKKADNGDPDPGVCRGIDGACGGDNGDPHLSTFDGYRFDLQAVGEFVAVKSNAGDLEIQTRQGAYFGSRTVAVNTAVAMKVAGVRLGFYLDHGSLVVHRDGTAVSLPLGNTQLPGGGRVNHAVDPLRGDSFAVVWPDGSAAWVVQVGRWGLQLSVQPRAARTGTLTGLLGSYDGDKTNDVSTVDGKVLAQPPSFDDLYHTYAPGWRVTDANSLFDYAAGTSTKDFTDLSFPDRPSTVDTLAAPARDAAQAVCALLGVIDPGVVADCVLDVASTGQAMFAVNAMRVQDASSPSDGGTGTGGTGTDGGTAQIGQSQTLTVTPAGVTMSFDGRAGQRAYVDVTATTLPNGCGGLEMDDASGSELSLGCVRDGTGQIDSTVLPRTGRYQVKVTGTGSITMRVITSDDAVTPIIPDGPAVTGTVIAPGQWARLTFSATAGEKVFVDITGSTVQTGCGDVYIMETKTTFSAIGCIGADHTGVIDTATLHDTGEYSIVVDPPGTGTGSATVRLYVVHDQQQAISLNGPAVLASVTEPGAQFLLTFAATAGQQVTVAGTGATDLLRGCGALALRNPDGTTIDIGCVDGSTGVASLGPVTLKDTGTYTLALDPGGRDTGSVSLRIHT